MSARTFRLPRDFPRDARRDLARFDALVRHIGWDGWPGRGIGSGPAWQAEMKRVKRERKQVLSSLQKAGAGVDQGRRRQAEILLIKGWHLVFHCYGMATDSFPEGDSDDLAVRQKELQNAYLEAFEAIL